MFGPVDKRTENSHSDYLTLNVMSGKVTKKEYSISYVFCSEQFPKLIDNINPDKYISFSFDLEKWVNGQSKVTNKQSIPSS